MGLTKYRLGDLIQQRREKYSGAESLPVRGVSRDGFIDAKIPDADTSLYNVFYRGDFVFNPARMEVNSIAHNCEFEKAICSSLYEVFYVSRPDIILSEYLNLFVKRYEFARLCEYIGWGSAREYCRIANISDIEINLPPLPIQKKYVDIYTALLRNQRSYERGLDDLKLTCDAFIERLKVELPLESIISLVELSEKKNENNAYSLDDVRGISIEKAFIPTKANMDGVSLKPYLVIDTDEFAYVPVTSRNGGKISLALNNDAPCICSSSYIAFRVQNKEKLLPAYLMLFLSRSEFDRYARFCSWGSARETFDWGEMQSIKIPIPPIDVQRSIIGIYRAYKTRKTLNERLKTQLRDICPILIKGSLEEATVS